MGQRWKEREWWLAVLTPILVLIMNQAGMDDETVMATVIPLVSWILGRLLSKGLAAKNGGKS